MAFFFADESKWQRAVDALNRSADRGDPAGADTEFYDVDIRQQSCVARSKVHLISVAIKRWPHVLHPRGFHVADAAVFLAPVLEFGPFRRWLESSVPKVIHNLGVDWHSLRNHGVIPGGCVNSLARARWVFPERARGRGFSLDSLGVDLLAAGKTESFAELFSEEVEEVVRTKTVTTVTCSCGVEKCRKRKGHEKTSTVSSLPIYKRSRKSVPLQDVVIGHSLWERAVAYAARDAVLALNLSDLIDRQMSREVPWPW